MYAALNKANMTSKDLIETIRERITQAKAENKRLYDLNEAKT